MFIYLFFSNHEGSLLDRLRISSFNVVSILSGTGMSDGKIQCLQNEKLIKKTSIVYTSGSGGLFKPGIPIGRIKYRPPTTLCAVPKILNKLKKDSTKKL